MAVERYTDAYYGEGKTLALVAPYALDAGEGAKVGSIFGVAKEDLLISVSGQFETEGEFNLTKVGSQAWSVGDKIYWDNSARVCTSDSAAGMLIGVATVAAGAGAGVTTGTLKLCGPTELFEGAQAAVVVLTDSTGGSGTHDDTLADGLTVTNPAAITDYAAVVNMTDPVTKAQGEAVSAALAVLENEVTALTAKVTTIVTDLTTQNQNDSDLAQKILEIRTVLVTAGLIDA